MTRVKTPQDPPEYLTDNGIHDRLQIFNIAKPIHSNTKINSDITKKGYKKIEN